MTDARVGCIGLDWGTTRARAYRMDASGHVLERRSRPLGVRLVARGAFPATLLQIVGDWIDEEPGAPVVASGMVGGQHGWVETPYLDCPAAPSDLARALVEAPAGIASRVWIVPGLTVDDRGGLPDVMRGEETELVGALSEGRAEEHFLLPGTHSKWARVERGRVTALATFPSGELFQLLCEHSTLGARGVEGASDRESLDRVEAFERGAALGVSEGARLGGSLRRLFSARSRVARRELAPGDACEYLSGLIVGCEVREALEGGWASQRLTLVGDDALRARYERVLARAGVGCRRGPRDAAARGQYRLARLAGLVGEGAS